MKKKPNIEADLDPRGTRHSRPGSKIADSAIANSRPASSARRKPAAAAPRASGKLEADLDAAGTRHTRPGGTAAARAVEATRPKRKRGR